MPSVIIMVAEKNLPTLKSMLPYCKKNISCSDINLIASKGLKTEIERIPGVNFIDEDTVLPGLTLNNVFNVIECITGERKRAGWYFQQFLKLAWSYYTADGNYIVLDADTFPLNPISFQQNDGVYLFTEKLEYHKPYFQVIDKLFNGKVKRVDPKVSFVAEHMIFDCDIVKELIEKIDTNDTLKGNTWWKKILYSVDTPENLLSSGFSEFETYGNYIFTYYPSKVKMRKLRTLREGLRLLGSNPSIKQLTWATNNYDIISIENKGHYNIFDAILTTFYVLPTKSEIFRHVISLKSWVYIWSLTYKNIRSIYRKLKKISDVQFEK